MSSSAPEAGSAPLRARDGRPSPGFRGRCSPSRRGGIVSSIGGDFAPEHILLAPQVIIDPDVVPQSLGAGLNGTVRATCPLEGSVVASGDFTATADGRVRLRRAGLWDGTAWQPLADGLPASAITLEPFAGGVAAAMSDGVLHWNGIAWSRLGDVFDGPVQALAVFEGELMAGGAFTHAGSDADRSAWLAGVTAGGSRSAPG